MASRRACSIGRLPQVIDPLLGGMSPIARCRRLVLPEPLGPSRTVGGPEAMVSDKSSRIATGPATRETCENTIGRSPGSADTSWPDAERPDGTSRPSSCSIIPLLGTHVAQVSPDRVHGERQEFGTSGSLDSPAA